MCDFSFLLVGGLRTSSEQNDKDDRWLEYSRGFIRPCRCGLCRGHFGSSHYTSRGAQWDKFIWSGMPTVRSVEKFFNKQHLYHMGPLVQSMIPPHTCKWYWLEFESSWLIRHRPWKWFPEPKTVDLKFLFPQLIVIRVLTDHTNNNRRYNLGGHYNLGRPDTGCIRGVWTCTNT